jgi:hypothetical protein
VVGTGVLQERVRAGTDPGGAAMGEEEIGASYRWRSRGGVGKVTDQGAERVWEGSWAPRRNRSANGDDVDLLMLHD